MFGRWRGAVGNGARGVRGTECGMAIGRQLRAFQGHSDDVSSVDFSPDGRQFLTRSEDGTARMWKVE